jgi:hypothetical protein
MTLSAGELKRIDERLKTYQIKYSEIYHEILDHIISAIEKKRGEGDNSDVETLFQQVVDGHFGGYDGIRDMVVKHEAIYRKSIKKIWGQSLKHYLSWPMLGFTLVVLLLSLQLPNVEPVKLWLVIGCILLAFSPVVYASFSLPARVLKTIKGTQPFLKIHLIGVAGAPASFFSLLLLYLLWSFMDYLPPILFMAIMMRFALFNLAAMHFCRQFTVLNPIVE